MTRDLLPRRERDYTPRRKASGKRGAIPRDIRIEVLDRDEHRCRKCGFSDPKDVGLELHHVVEVALGGDDRPANLIVLCHLCHSEWTWCQPQTVKFDAWLGLPPARWIIGMLAVGAPEDVSAAQWLRDLRAVGALLRKPFPASPTPTPEHSR
jgi:hypothetical protein